MQLTGDVHAISCAVRSVCHPSHRHPHQILAIKRLSTHARCLAALRPVTADCQACYTTCSRINIVFAASASADMPSVQQKSLPHTCAAAGQAHLLQEWDSLTDAEQQELAADIQALDLEYVKRAFIASKAVAEAANHHNSKPVRPDDIVTLQNVDEQQRSEWRQLGLKLIAQGKVGVLLLAGGQGTRLGSDLPKGCYNVGLPSHKSLFQLQSERLLAVQRLAAAAAGDGSSAAAVQLPWFIMTSPFTHADTVQHFESHDYFGLNPAQVTFFQQGFLPCLTPEGKLILETSSTVSKAPDGNGGLYRALQSSGTLAKMQAMGLEALDVYCVDNILARVADPEYIGCCYSRGSQLGCRVVAKAHPEEKVGVFAYDNRGGLQVLEYSELDPVKASATDPSTGKLYYNWSNICMHYFSIAWLAAAAEGLAQAAAYHIANKQIPAKNGVKVPGVKLEMFIFDPFCTVKAVTLFEVDRRDHFAPVKNAPGSAADSPDTARAALLAQGARWVLAAGGRLADGVEGVEVSPLLSYAGEGLERVVAGNVVGLSGQQAVQMEPSSN